MNRVPFLNLRNINPDDKLIKLLPFDVASMYHALPVATDGSRITIAMATPEDTNASAAITSAIKAPICLVQADSKEIDQRLAEVWLTNPSQKLSLLVWTPNGEIDPSIQFLFTNLAELFKVSSKEVRLTWSNVSKLNALYDEALQVQPDLILIHVPNPSLSRGLSLDFAINKLIRLNVSILIARNPRWPLQRILLGVLDSHDLNMADVDWAIRMAHGSQAAVTIMPLLPPVPQMYGKFIRHSLTSLLTSNDPLGKKMRRIAKRMTTEEISATFKIREGFPLDQLRCEVEDSDTDIVIINAEPQNHIWRWLNGEVVNNLFLWFDRLLMITTKNFKGDFKE